MIAIALVLVIVVAAIAIAASHTTTAPKPTADVEALLVRWRQAGLLDDEQVRSIAAFERGEAPQRPGAPPATPPAAHHRATSRVPVVAEALGYLGGSLALGGIVLIVARSWPDLAVAARLAITATTAVAFVLVGWALAKVSDPALERMQAFVWLLSTAATAMFAVVVATDAIDAESPAAVALAGALAVAIESGALWRGRDRPVQQLATLGGTIVAAGCAATIVATPTVAGLTVWALGVAVAVTGATRRVRAPLMTDAVGAIAATVGSIIVASEWEGALVFACASALALCATVAVPSPLDRGDRLVFGVIGGIAALQVVPGTLGWYAHDAGAATGLVVWMLGLATVVAGLSRWPRTPRSLQVVGSLAMVGGAALTGVQWPEVAPAFGVLTAAGLLVAGMRPGAALLSLAGSLGLLVNVPWLITRWFPGEERAPLLIIVSGVVILALAVLLARRASRLRAELR